MKKTALLIALACLAHNASAADLLDILRAAQDNDPTFAAAKATLAAGQEKLPQGRAGLLPNVALSANTTWNDNDITLRSTNTSAPARYNSHGYMVSLSQPLFRWQNWLSYDQAKIQVAQAELAFAQARQDLILRVAQAYFDVLYASESLAAVRANKTAINQQLASAKQSFEVGTATITDTHEAQARFDLAQAQEIAAESDLEIKQHALQLLIGKAPGSLAGTRPDLELRPPEPRDMATWVAAAEKDALSVQNQQSVLALASREADKQQAGHYPTLDLVASKGSNSTLGSLQIGMMETQVQSIGVQLNLPLYSGGSTSSRQREAVAQRGAAESALEAARRTAAQSARQAYLGVVNGLAQVKALKAAQASSQLALEANKLGYEVGVRINIDVLNAENQVYVTRRDHAKAVLDTLMAQLRLKAASGTLSEDDVSAINTLLARSTTP